MQCQLVRERVKEKDNVNVDRMLRAIYQDSIQRAIRESKEDEVVRQQQQLRKEEQAKNAREIQRAKEEAAERERQRKLEKQHAAQIAADLLKTQTNEAHQATDASKIISLEKAMLTRVNRAHLTKIHSETALGLATSNMRLAFDDFNNLTTQLKNGNIQMSSADQQACKDSAWEDVAQKIRAATQAREQFEQDCLEFNRAVAHLKEVLESTKEEEIDTVDVELQIRPLNATIEIRNALEFLDGRTLAKYNERCKRRYSKARSQFKTQVITLAPAITCVSAVMSLELYYAWKTLIILMLLCLFIIGHFISTSTNLTELELIARDWIQNCNRVMTSGISKLKKVNYNSDFLHEYVTTIIARDIPWLDLNSNAVIFILAALIWFISIILIKFCTGFF